MLKYTEFELNRLHTANVLPKLYLLMIILQEWITSIIAILKISMHCSNTLSTSVSSFCVCWFYTLQKVVNIDIGYGW